MCYQDSADTGQRTERGGSNKCCGNYYMGLSYGNDVVGQSGPGALGGSADGGTKWAGFADRILPS